MIVFCVILILNPYSIAFRGTAVDNNNPNQSNNIQMSNIKNLSIGNPILTKDNLDLPRDDNSIKENSTVAGEVIIKFKSNVKLNEESILLLNEKYNVQSIEQVFKNSRDPHLSNIFKLKYKEDVDPKIVADDYNNNSYVIYAQPNYIMEICSIPNDPFYHSYGSWNQPYDDLWGLKRIQCENAWNITVGSDNVTVAVVDTGIDYTHEDITDNLWINGDEVPDNGIDDDNDGFIDNIYGSNFAYNDGNPIDDNGHGTHCAGIIGAVGNNSIGVVGVNWNISIMAVKALDNNGFGYSDILAQAICWAADQGANIISSSWSSSYRVKSNPVIEDAVRYAYNKGCILVFAAGNNNDDISFYSPQNMNETITVAATDYLDRKTYFSNWGEKVDVCAPGVDILSLRANGTGDPSKIIGDKYYYDSGTSQAASFVAGLCALLLSRNHSLNYTDIRRIITTNSDNSPPSFPYIGGRINVGRTVMYDFIRADILNPSGDTNVIGLINITGNAFGENFQRYIVEYGRDCNPIHWIEIGNANISIENDVLATLNTTTLDDGLYTLKLKVICLHSKVETISRFIVNNKHDALIVDGNGIGNYTSIQDAIYASGDKDDIYVYNGSYSETLWIDRSITLEGNDSISTMIINDRGPCIIYISADNVNIKGFTLIGGTTAIKILNSRYINISYNILPASFNGIYVINSKSVNISRNNLMEMFYYSIYIYNSTNNIISNNDFIDMYYTIYIYNSTDNFISDNRIIRSYIGIILRNSMNNIISNNTIYGIIFLYSSPKNRLIQNTLSLEGIYIYGEKLSDWNTHIIENNSLNGKPVYYMNNKTGLTLNSSSFGEILLANCSDIVIQNISIENSLVGILIGFSNNISIKNCSLKYNSAGIIFYNSSNSIVRDSILTDGTYGLYLMDSSHNLISNCDFYKNQNGVYISYGLSNNIINCSFQDISYDSLYIDSSSKNIVMDCIISNSKLGEYDHPSYEIGLNLYNSSLNTILRCIFKNEINGIYLSESYNNTINDCTLYNNWNGIKLYSSSRNNFYNCSFHWNIDERTTKDEPSNGVFAYESSNNTFNRCSIYNFYNGILLNYAMENIVSNCNILNNTIGIKIEYPSKNNLIYYNHFRNIKYNAWEDKNSINTWYNSMSKKGNYWHDYTGTDANNDGIGDTPYKIPSGYRKDLYPLGLFCPIADFSFQNICYKTVSFNETCWDPDGIIISKTWDFGDGTTSTDNNPVHIYKNIGIYKVTLTVIDDDGKIGKKEENIEITDPIPPTIRIIKPKNIIYIHNYEVPILLHNPLIIGDVDIIVDARDDFSGVDRVEFYINGILAKNDTTPPYIYRWTSWMRNPLFHVYYIKVVAYDNAGNSAYQDLYLRRFL